MCGDPALVPWRFLFAPEPYDVVLTVAMAPVVGHDAVEDRHVGSGLHLAVDGGVDPEPAVVGLLLAELLEGEEPCHLARVSGAELDFGSVEACRDRLVPCGDVLLMGDVPELEHLVKDNIPSLAAFVRM